MRDFKTRIAAAFGRHLTAGQSLLSRIVGDSLNDCMRWRHEYTPGPYHRNDVVRDAEWTMVANKDTEDKPAPQPVGDPVWLTDHFGGVTWDTTPTASVSRLIVGVRVTVAQSLVLKRLRVWIPDGADGMSASIWVVEDPLGSPIQRQLVAPFTIDNSLEDKWFDFSPGPTFRFAGETFDLFLTIDTTTGESTFAGVWDYKRKNGDPDDGEAWHQSGNNQDQLRFSQVDKDDVNRSADLDNIVAGSTIFMAASGQNWTVLEAIKIGSVYTFIVDPASRAGEATSSFTFTYYGQFPIPYVRDAAFWQSVPHVSGLYSQSGYANVTTTDDAYGVDFERREAVISPDWDVLSISA